MLKSLEKILFVTLILIINFSVKCNAEDYVSMTTASAQRKMSSFDNLLQKELETFKVGYIRNTGFLTEDIPDHKTGYGYEYMEFLSNYARCNFEYVEAKDWEDLVSKLQNGKVDIIPELPGDYKKVPNATRTDHVVGRYSMEFVAKEIKPNMKIGILTFSHAVPSFPEVARGEGFTYQFVPFNKHKDMASAFQREEIDGYIDAMTDPRRSQNVHALFDRQSYRLLIRSDRKDLYNRINLAMEQLLLYQPNIRDRLNATYFLTSGFPLTLSTNEKNYLKEKGKLKTAIFSDHQPYAYYDEEGQLIGVIPSIIKRISEDLNIEIEIVDTNDDVAIGEMIKNGEIDFVADTVCDYGWAANFNMNPTRPYLTIEYVPVTKTDYEIDPSSIHKVACVRNLFYTTHYVEPHFPESQRLYVDNTIDSLHAVSEGRADIAFVQRNAATSLIEEAETYSIEAKTASVYSAPISLGVYSNSHPYLWQILNKEMGHINPDWISDLVNMNEQTRSNLSLKWILHHHPLRFFGVVAILVAAIAGLFFYRWRMRQQRLELVEHMAYTDLRYEMPNVPYLEREVPLVIESLESDMKPFFVIFSLASSAAATATQGHSLVDKKFKEMAKKLAEEKPVIITAAGIDVDHLICFCKGKDIEELVDWAKTVIENNKYMDTVAESAKIVIHTRAGITYYDENFSVQQAVDRALIACHQNLTDTVTVFDEHLQETLTTNYTIEGRMEQALIDGEFKAWYQPKYDLRTRKIVGAEALVRWISPELGFMPPGKFIPLFERNGFVIQIDYYLLEQTCKLQRARLDAGKEIVPISVNQSRLHMTEEGYLEKLQMIVNTYELPAGAVELEITETMFGDFDAKAGQENAARIVNELHKMGFSVSVDDFGSGYSSFMLLGYLPLDVMKIDRSLLTGADKSPRMRDILGNVIKLGHALKMKVLCEGIETPEQEELLLDLGCHYGQGFLNAKPMPVEDFINFFEKRNAEVQP